MLVREFTKKSYIMFRASTFLKEALRQMRLLRNIRNIQHDEQYKSGLLNVIKKGMINFESYSFIRRCEFVVGKNIRWQNYVKTHHFLVSVQNLAPSTENLCWKAKWPC